MNRESEQPSSRAPYSLAGRFAAEAAAGQAYFKIQDALLYGLENDLSAYRLQLNQIWHVAVPGEPPPRSLDRRLRRILAAGEPTTLPSEVLALLLERRTRTTQLGPWVERHHRPGEHLYHSLTRSRDRNTPAPKLCPFASRFL